MGRHGAVTGAERAASVEERLRGLDWDFPAADEGRGIHSIHPYPAKFIAAIPRAIIQTLGVQPGTAVLDPFCGAGTTLVVAQELGIQSIGIDLNPIACLMSSVKTTPVPNGFAKTAARVAMAADRTDAEVPDIPNVEHWFSREARLSVAALTEEISRVRDITVRQHLRLALSSIIVRVSNQDSDTRYAAVEKHVTPKAVHEQFLTACARIEKAKLGRNTDASATVIERDIMAVTPDQIETPISLVMTSPPYPNAYEYWLYHKYRMWWLGLDPLAVKEREIGARAHYFKKNHATFDEFRGQMADILGLLACVLVPSGYACFVIGRSRIHGKDYDNAEMISEEAEKVGLSEVVRISRVIKAHRKSFNLSHARIKTEEVLVLQRTR